MSHSFIRCQCFNHHFLCLHPSNSPGIGKFNNSRNIETEAHGKHRLELAPLPAIKLVCFTITIGATHPKSYSIRSATCQKYFVKLTTASFFTKLSHLFESCQGTDDHLFNSHHLRYLDAASFGLSTKDWIILRQRGTER